MAITSVTVKVVARKKNPSGWAKIKIHVLVGGMVYSSEEWNNLTYTYETYQYIWTTNPKTGEDWVEDDLDAIGGGGYLESGIFIDNNARATQIWLVVTDEGGETIYRPQMDFDTHYLNVYPVEYKPDEYYKAVDEETQDGDTTYVENLVRGLGLAWSWAIFDCNPEAPIPEVTTDPADDITYTTATLNGTLDEDTGVACTCGFDYGLTLYYGTRVESEGTYNETESFDYGISGLISGETYHFRAYAYNGTDYGYGQDLEFTTLAEAHIPWIWYI